MGFNEAGILTNVPQIKTNVQRTNYKRDLDLYKKNNQLTFQMNESIHIKLENNKSIEGANLMEQNESKLYDSA